MTKIILVFLVIFIVLSAWLITFPIPTNKKAHTKTPSPSPTSNSKASQNIEVYSPKKLDSVSSPINISGRARVFENVVSIRLKALSEEVIIETQAYANAPDVGQFGNFSKNIFFESDENEGILEVFQASAKDGSEIDKVIIPLIFK